MIRVGTGTLAPLIGGVPRAGFHDNEQMGKYDTLNKEELVRLIEARDRREATRYGGSLFFGSDTWIGLAYLALGMTSTGESTIYVMIGRP